MRVLVIGAGSIGRRHLNNLRALGITQLAVCDADAARAGAAAQETGAEAFPDCATACREFGPDAGLVCTPPATHLAEAARLLDAGAHLFIEKPLSNSLEGVDELAERARTQGRIVQVGYNLRFHPGIRTMRDLLNSGVVGTARWIRCEFGQYLPDWRPSQDYRQSYTARRELGGGIILDGSHEIDYLIWLMGPPREVLCMAGRVSDLEIDVEDCATVLLRFDDAQADVHLDCLQRTYSRCCWIAGSDGTIAWDYLVPGVRFCPATTGAWEWARYDFEPNDMYLAELHHFLDCVSTGAAPLVGLEDARLVLQVALAARDSATAGVARRVT